MPPRRLPLIIVFAKLPVPGRVKTRLAAVMGEAVALGIHQRLARLTGEILRQRSPSDLCVFYTLGEESEAEHWLQSVDFPPVDWLREQTEGDLGLRQEQALAWAFEQGYGKVALIGVDCPGLRPDLLLSTWNGLEAADLVFGPASDGGYYLLAAKPSVNPEALFSQVRWSHPSTLADCSRNAETLGLRTVTMEILADIDRFEDWISFRKQTTRSR